ncbi:hypothetical protein BKA56DRAFT_597531 [Ilyonectria sp. MPI-CAGE-AT-0026]|nr:hypothetical protein BKA56DRAFT_597531 [Ilyonectria sp. MPI-CAGE-AT-0026]
MIQMPAYAVLGHSLPMSRADPPVDQSPHAKATFCPSRSAAPNNLPSCQGLQEIPLNPTDPRSCDVWKDGYDPSQDTHSTTAFPYTDSTLSPATFSNFSSNTSGPSSGGDTGVNSVSSISQVTIATPAADKTAASPFRDPAQVPKCSPAIFVYPRSGAVIGTEFHSRFREVVDIFRQNTEEHPRLREYVQHVDYTLRMCGPSPEESHPSILVFCRPSEFAYLRGLLTSKELKFQYCLRRPSRKYPWKRWSSSRSSHELDSSGTRKPLFNLYFWRHQRPKNLLWGMESMVLLRSGAGQAGSDTRSRTTSLLTMCGSGITLPGSDTRSSTLGYVIRIGSEFYGMTASHAVRPLEPQRRGSQEPESGEGYRSAQLDSDYVNERSGQIEATTSVLLPHQDLICHPGTDVLDESPEEDDYLVDDVEYESLTDEECNCHDEASDIFATSTASVSATGHGARDRAVAVFPSQDELDTSGESDLDWALIKMVHAGDRRPNAFIDPEDSSHPAFLSKIAADCPNEETPVLILTGEQPPKKGMLQPVASVLGGINGNRAANVWTVIPSSNDLKKGDSGSVVVDAQTYALYGQVVALNPLGEVYISPFAAIMKQIQNRFSGAVVALSEPFPTLLDLILFHIQQHRNDIALELLEYLKGAHLPDGSEDLGKAAIERFWPTARDKAQDSPTNMASSKDTTEIKQVLSITRSKMRCREQRRNVIERRLNQQDGPMKTLSFPNVWEHGVLPFLIEFIPRWCGPCHVISIIRGSTPGSRRIYFMTKRQLSRARRLMIAAHVRDLLPSDYLQKTTFAFSAGTVDRLIPGRSFREEMPNLSFRGTRGFKVLTMPIPRNPYYFGDPCMGDSIGIRGNGIFDDSTATLGPCLIVGGVSCWLVNCHPFIMAYQHLEQVQIEHPSFQDRNRCLSEGHDAMMDIDIRLGNLGVTSGLDLKTARISQDPYWQKLNQEPPLVLTDWALIPSKACKANITRRFPSVLTPLRKEPLVRTTSAVIPGGLVVYAGRTSGHKHGRVCEIPAYVSAAANGTDKDTREWFIEETYEDEDFMIRGDDGDSGAAIVDVESNKLVGQLWGHNRCFVPGPHMAFFTAIGDVFDDIQEKYDQEARPQLPQHRDEADQVSAYPNCRQCYDLRTYLDSRRSSRMSLQSMIMGMGDGELDLTSIEAVTELVTPRDHHRLTGIEEAGLGLSIAGIDSLYAAYLSEADLEDHRSFHSAKRAANDQSMEGSSLDTKKQRVE